MQLQVHEAKRSCLLVQGKLYNQAQYRAYAEGFAAEFMRKHSGLQEARRTMSANSYARLLEQSYWCLSILFTRHLGMHSWSST